MSVQRLHIFVSFLHEKQYNGGSFCLFLFELPKQFHNRILKDFLVQDFSSNDFSEIYVVFLLYKQKLLPKN